MANILPFNALRYNPARVRLEDVLTQPYDKISPEMQKKYYAASPFNLVRLELGQAQPDDDHQRNVYSRAAESLRDWRREGVVMTDAEPSIYAYAQRFEVPGAPGTWKERLGFIALGRLRDYSEGIVFRHEQTLARPKADRLNLLRATRAHSGQIFMLYSDPVHEIDALLRGLTARSKLVSQLNDEYGVEHRLWQISDQATILLVRDLMVDRRLIIADGHHRYETALVYRNERRTADAPSLMDPVPARTGHMRVNFMTGYENLMMTFFNMDAEGLMILPTHRVVFGLPGFSPQRMRDGAAKFFSVEKLSEGTSAEALTSVLAEAGTSGAALVTATADGAYLLRAREGGGGEILREMSPRQRQLDVVQLHKLLLEKVLEISEEDIRKQTYVQYIRSASEALDRVRDGAQAAFLMNPVTLGQMRDVAFAGEVMPQKSTDFYPKLLSGLTLYALD